MSVESRFVGESARVYADLVLGKRGDRPKVIASSLVDAYEMALGRKCMFVGASKDRHKCLALEEAGYDVEIVTPEKLEALVENRPQIEGLFEPKVGLGPTT